MRDIRTDLQDRADSVAQQISAENARFASLVSQIESEQNGKLTHLKAQLRLANKLIEFMFWHDNLRVELAAQISLAEAVENIIKKPRELLTYVACSPDDALGNSDSRGWIGLGKQCQSAPAWLGERQSQ